MKLTNHTWVCAGDELLREITDMVGLRHEAEVKRAELLQRVTDLQAALKEKQEKAVRVSQIAEFKSPSHKFNLGLSFACGAVCV